MAPAERPRRERGRPATDDRSEPGPRRRIPSVDALLRSEPGRRAAATFGRPLVKHAISEVLDRVRADADDGTEPPETGELSFGGWFWRYDLEATGPSCTTVTLTYDWSAVPPEVREYLQFPPFAQDHLDNSLQHLSDLVA